MQYILKATIREAHLYQVCKLYVIGPIPMVQSPFRELSFGTGRGDRLFVGGPQFLGWSKGVTIFFQCSKGGDQKFLRIKEGGTKFFSQNFLRLWRNFFVDMLFKNSSHLRYNLFLTHSSYNIITFFLNPGPLTFYINYCPLHYLCKGDVFSLWGDQIFFYKTIGRDQNIPPYAKGGTRILLRMQRGE